MSTSGMPPAIPPAAPPPPPAQGKKSSKTGCLIAVLVVLLLGMGACAYACFVVLPGKMGQMMVLGLNQMKPVAESALASDVTAEQKAVLWQEWDAYSTMLAEMDFRNPPPGVNPETVALPMQQLQGYLADQSFTSDEIDQFVASLRQARAAN